MTRILRKFSPLPIAFGGASISGEGGGYGFGDINEQQALDLLKLSFDRGVNIFDSAPIYGFGLSEKRIGKAFKDKREKVFFISKSGVTWHSNKRVDMTNDPKVTQKMLEQSLRDLQSEYIDLYMIHWPDEKVDIRLPLEVLSKAKIQGKIKHIGLCNTTKEDLKKAQEVDVIDVVQSQLNVFETDSVELFDTLDQDEIDFMSWGTLDKGILTGRVNSTRTFDKSDCRSWAPWWKAMDLESRFKKMEKINKHLEKNGHTGLELAIGHNLSFPQVSSVLCGARNQKQLEGLLKALENLPSQEFVDEVKEIVAKN